MGWGEPDISQLPSDERFKGHCLQEAFSHLPQANSYPRLCIIPKGLYLSCFEGSDIFGFAFSLRGSTPISSAKL